MEAFRLRKAQVRIAEPYLHHEPGNGFYGPSLGC